MRKWLAYAAAASLALGAILLPAGTDAKPIGFKGGFGGKFAHFGGAKFGKHGFHKFHGGKFTKFGKFGKHGKFFVFKRGHRFAHRFQRHRGFGFGFPVLAASTVVVVREIREPPAPPAEPLQVREHKVYQVGSHGGCTAEQVKVPTANGEGVVNVFRC